MIGAQKKAETGLPAKPTDKMGKEKMSQDTCQWRSEQFVSLSIPGFRKF
jgi:hypothetical protein